MLDREEVFLGDKPVRIMTVKGITLDVEQSGRADNIVRIRTLDYRIKVVLDGAVNVVLLEFVRLGE